MKRYRYYTPEEINFIENNVSGRSYIELTVLFNNRFSPPITITQITGFLSNHKLSNGRDQRFRPGFVPHNKGQTFRWGMSGWFTKGHMTANYRPVGSERINSDGIIEVKIDNPRTWKSKHAVIWEKLNGPIPKGHVVIFSDGNKRNFISNNLLLVSRAELVVMNKKGLISAHPELTKTGKLVADIIMKTTDRKRAVRRRKRKCKTSDPALR